MLPLKPSSTLNKAFASELTIYMFFKQYLVWKHREDPGKAPTKDLLLVQLQVEDLQLN